VQFGAVHTRVVCTHTTKSTGKGAVAAASTLNGERLAHDWAAATENLKVGHAASSGRNGMGSSRRGERAEGGGRGLV
jgi:hypothetical protein